MKIFKLLSFGLMLVVTQASATSQAILVDEELRGVAAAKLQSYFGQKPKCMGKLSEMELLKQKSLINELLSLCQTGALNDKDCELLARELKGLKI